MLYLKIHKIHNLYNNLARRRNAIILRCTAVYFVVSHGGNVFSARIVQKKIAILASESKRTDNRGKYSSSPIVNTALFTTPVTDIH